MRHSKTSSFMIAGVLSASFLLLAGCRSDTWAEPPEKTEAAEQQPSDPEATGELAIQRLALEERTSELAAERQALNTLAVQLQAQQEQLAASQTRVAERESELAAKVEALDARFDELATTLDGRREPEPEAAVEDVRQPDPSAPPADGSAGGASFRLVLPIGSTLQAELLDPLSTRRAVPGDAFRAVVSEDVVIDGEVAVAAGSHLLGRVVDVRRGKKIGGQARLDLQFEELEPLGGSRTTILASYGLAGVNRKKRDAATIGGAAAGGAVLGRVLDGDEKTRGTVIGGLLGAAAGAAVASRRGDREIELEAGTGFEVLLERPAVVVMQSASP